MFFDAEKFNCLERFLEFIIINENGPFIMLIISIQWNIGFVRILLTLANHWSCLRHGSCYKMSFKRISADETKTLIDSGDINIIDIRDSSSYFAGHIAGAKHAEDMNIESFIESGDKEKPLLIYCYHGIASQSAAGFFDQNGFENVYSLDGGYSGWSDS